MQGRPFLDYVNNLPVEVSPGSEDHVYLGGATSRKATGDSLGGGGPGGDGVTLEEVRDDLANVLTEGDNITIAPNDGANTITISSPSWLPTGGTIGQALVKASGSDFDVEWDAVVVDPGTGESGYTFHRDFFDVDGVTPLDPPDATAFRQTWFAADTGDSYTYFDTGDEILANGVWVQTGSNGSPSLTGNLDGGAFDSIYGGSTPIDGGTF